MGLVVLRSLAVYGGTAAVLLLLAHRFVEPLRLRVALFLACAPGVLTGVALLRGDVYAPVDIAYGSDPLGAISEEMGVHPTQTPLLHDVVAYYIPARKAVREAFKHGRLPLWNRFQMAGEPLLALQQPAVLHPGTWLGFLLPLAQAWTFDMTLRLLIALVSAYLLFRDLRCGELAAWLGAVGWAFCDHLVFYLGFSISAAVGPFPLLLLGLRRLVTRADGGAVALTVVALLLITLSGHPETLLHCVAAAGIYFLFELAFAGGGKRLRPLMLALAAGLLALGLAAVVLLPFFEILPHTRQHVGRTAWYATMKKSVALSVSGHRSMRNILPFAFGVSGHGRGEPGLELPAAYAGSLIFPLALVGLSSTRREKWVFLLFTAVGLAFWARLVGVTDAISKLPLFDIAINEYLVFLAAFGSVALAALGAQRLREGRAVPLFAVAAVAAAVVLALAYRNVRPQLLALEMPADYLRRRILLEVAPLLLAAALLFAVRRGGGPAGAAILLVLLLAQRRLETQEIYPEYASRTFYPPLEVLQAILAGAPARVTAADFLFVPGAPALYELEDVRGYGALTLESMAETFPLWCVDQPVSYNRVDDPTRPFLSFLNVRHVIASAASPAPPGWTIVSEGNRVRVLENPSALPRAFVPSFLLFESDPARQVEALRAIEDFGRDGVVEGRGSGGRAANGEADVRITSYSGQRMALAIDAKEAAIVATSVPGWPGWKLTLDGRRARLLAYNRAFLAFSVSPGRHVAVLRYLPDGFLRGAAVSLATLVLAGVLLFRAERRGGREARRISVEV